MKVRQLTGLVPVLRLEELGMYVEVRAAQAHAHAARALRGVQRPRGRVAARVVPHAWGQREVTTAKHTEYTS